MTDNWRYFDPETGVTPEGSGKTWTYTPRTATHRALHDRQTWRRPVAQALYRLGDRLSGLADRVDPWHEDDQWYTAPPAAWYTFTSDEVQVRQARTVE